MLTTEIITLGHLLGIPDFASLIIQDLNRDRCQSLDFPWFFRELFSEAGQRLNAIQSGENMGYLPETTIDNLLQFVLAVQQDFVRLIVILARYPTGEQDSDSGLFV